MPPLRLPKIFRKEKSTTISSFGKKKELLIDILQF